jgi:hypothetical protein
MAHVEVSKLSSHELAELACTYAALILHDDSQDITGIIAIIQETRLPPLSKPRESILNPTGPSFSLELSKGKMFLPFLTLEVKSHQALLLANLPKLPQSLRRKLRRKEAKNNKRRRKPHHLLLLKSKIWIWVTSLVDSLSDKKP